jgi:DNA-binding MarR family transcriptional regulator
MVKQPDRVAVPQAGEGKRGEHGYLGYLLRQAANAHRLRMDRALADLNVTTPQFAVLTMLSAYPGQSNADIARLALLTPQTTNQIVANLERAGLVRRRPHPSHGRILQVELAPAALGLLEACKARVQDIETEMLAGVPAGEEAAIRRWLVMVAASGSSVGGSTEQ